MKQRKSSFTFTELLMEIAVIATLAAMCLPLLTRSREMAKEVQCLDNMKQIGQCMARYAKDNNDFFPVGENDAGVTWYQQIAGKNVADMSKASPLYYGRGGFFDCPDTVGYAKIYGIHQALAPSWFPDQLWPRKHRRIGILGQPGMKMIVSEKGMNHDRNWGYNDFMTWRARWTDDTVTFQGSRLSCSPELDRDLAPGSSGGWEGPRSVRYRHNGRNSGLFGDGHASLNAKGSLNWKDNILIEALNQPGENYYGLGELKQ